MSAYAETYRQSDPETATLERLGSIGVFRSSPDGTCTFINARGCEITGLSHEDVIGRSWLDRISLADRRRLSRAMFEDVDEGRAARARYHHQRPDGTSIWVQIEAVPEINPGGRVTGFLGTIVDVTDREDADEALQTAREERARLEELVSRRSQALERAHRRLRDTERLAYLGTLAAGIAREIHRPLGEILEIARNALASEAGPDARDLQKRALSDTAREAGRCAGLIQDLIDCTRSAPERHTEDANLVAQRSCTLVSPYALENSATVDFQPAAHPLAVPISPIELEQVIVNVLRNAIESRTLGACVQVETRRSGGRIAICVRDNGRGISDAELPRVFEAFFTTRSEAGGIGLGLTVAHQILAQHKGSIDIESEPGVGTSVTISLPHTGPAVAQD